MPQDEIDAFGALIARNAKVQAMNTHTTFSEAMKNMTEEQGVEIAKKATEDQRKQIGLDTTSEVEEIVREMRLSYYRRHATNVYPKRLPDILESYEVEFKQALTTLTTKHQEELEALREDFKFSCGVIDHLYLTFGDKNEVVQEMKRYIAGRELPTKTDKTTSI